MQSSEGYHIAMRVANDRDQASLVFSLYRECQASFLGRQPRLLTQYYRALAIQPQGSQARRSVDEQEAWMIQSRDETLLQAALRALCQSGDQERALQLASLCTYRSVYVNNALMTGGDVKLAKSLYSQMLKAEQPDFLPNADTYNLLIEQYGKRSKLSSAYKVYQKMQIDGIRPTRRTYEILLQFVSQQKDRKLLHKLRDMMPLHQVSWNAPIVCYLVEGFSRTGQIDAAHEIMHEAAQLEATTGVTLIQAQTYMALLEGYLLIPSVDLCRELMAQLRGGPFEYLLEEIYSHSLQVFSEAHECDVAMQLYSDMQADYIQPLREDLLALVNALASSLHQEGRMPQLCQVFTDAMALGIYLDSLTYHRLLHIFMDAEKWDLVTLNCRAMLDCGLSIPLRSYEALLIQTAERIDPSLIEEIRASFRALGE